MSALLETNGFRLTFAPPSSARQVFYPSRLHTRLKESTQRTLDYLFHKLLPSVGHALAHGFMRDRTRSVRQDLLLQPVHSRELIAECHERVVRYHILSTHYLKPKIDIFSESELVIACKHRLTR